MSPATQAKFEPNGHAAPVNGWIDPYSRPWAAELESRADAILAELKRLLDRKVWSIMGKYEADAPSFTRMDVDELRAVARRSKARLGSANTPEWRMYGLHLYGKPFEQNCVACPETAAALARIPNLVKAGFSCLEAGARLPLHRGADRNHYRAHLGLIVPPGDCALRVTGEARRWKAGKMLMFDDTLVHEAWNLTPEHRIVLIADVAWIERPIR